MNSTHIFKINLRKKRNIPVYLLLLYYLIIVATFAKHTKAEKLPVLITVFIITGLAVTFLSVLEITSERSVFKRCRKLLSVFLLLLAPVTSFSIVEIMVSNFNPEMFEKYSIYNLVWYYLIVFFLYAISRSIRVTLIMNNFMIYLVSVMNYLVFLFRGNPIIPSDLLAWQTGMSVASNYTISITQGFVLATLIMFIMFVLGSKLEKERKKISLLNRTAVGLAYFLVSFLVYISFFHTDLIKTKIRVIDFFAPKYTYCAYGTAFGFVANVEAMKTEAPEGYTPEKVQEILDKLKNEKTKEKDDTTRVSQDKPNIIAIMNEAYSELSMVGDYPTNMSCHPYTSTLKENTTQGALYVSVFGGGTSDTEYEFMTGNSMAVMPQNSVPYQQFVTEPTDSLAATLKEQGYYNIAIHPYLPSGYKRDLVYPLLGFDEFLSKEDFDDPETIRSFISDRESYQKIIEQYEAKGEDKPLFIFNVTMQNHGGYSSAQVFDDANTVRLTDNPGHPEAEQYLSLLRQTDRDFEILVDYFSKVEEHTIVLLFGDHQPIAYSSFYDELASAGKLTYPEQNKYQVPFLIWANYDITEDDVDRISANYLSSYLLKTAGLQGTIYNDYLLKLYKEIPVINSLFYIDKENICHTYSEENAYSSLIKEYRMVGYNDALDKKEKRKEYFSTLFGG